MNKKIKIAATVAISSAFLTGCDIPNLTRMGDAMSPANSPLVSTPPEKPLAGVPATSQPLPVNPGNDESASECEVNQAEIADEDFVNVDPIES